MVETDLERLQGHDENLKKPQTNKTFPFWLTDARNPTL